MRWCFIQRKEMLFEPTIAKKGIDTIDSGCSYAAEFLTDEWRETHVENRSTQGVYNHQKKQK